MRRQGRYSHGTDRRHGGDPRGPAARRPDVRRAERAAAAQSAQIGISEAEFYPHISLLGTFGYSAHSITSLLEPGAFQGQAGPTFTWNIFNYGRIYNNVRYQDALFQQLVVDYQQAVLTAAGEVETGLIQFLKGQEQAQYQAASVDAAKKAVQLAVVQYRGGLTDFNRVATLEVTLVQQQNLLAQARGQIATGLINTYEALGGGWQIRLQETMPIEQLPPVPPENVLPPTCRRRRPPRPPRRRPPRRTSR